MQNILLAACPYCGKPNCIAHAKYRNRCEECGKRYAKYANYKSLQRTAYTTERQHLLEDIISEYRILARQGYQVPRDIEGYQKVVNTTPPRSIRCKSCGELKPVSQFRQYYNRPGYYKICSTCEKVDSRYKYLVTKQDAKGLVTEEAVELNKIEQIYDYRRQFGYKVPGENATQKVDLDNILSEMEEKANASR